MLDYLPWLIVAAAAPAVGVVAGRWGYDGRTAGLLDGVSITSLNIASPPPPEHTRAKWPTN